MICLILIWFCYGLSRMFQLPQFVWALRSSVWDVFINFLLIAATDRSKISGDQNRFFIELSLYPLSFFVNTPFNEIPKTRHCQCDFDIHIFVVKSQSLLDWSRWSWRIIVLQNCLSCFKLSNQASKLK